MLLVAGILNLISSYLIASIVNNFLAIYIVFFGLVIINMEILSIFSGIYDYNILIFSFLNLALSICLFKLKKSDFLKLDINFSKLKNAFLLDKSLIFLALAFFVLISISFILAYVMPPLEPDSQTYHFYRAFMFVKNHSLNHFDTNDIRALIMPINSEIVYSWIFALKHKFYNFALLSYFSYFAIISAIWQILSCMKFSIRKKIFAIFLFSSLASTVVEMSSLQTDIVVGALFICALALALKKNHFISSLAIAIALGVKTTSFILLAPYLIIIFLLNKKDFIKYILYLISNFIIFSSYNYILNFIQYQNPITNHAAYIGHQFWGGIKGYIANLIHFSFQFFDFCGFTWGYYINNKLFALKDMVFHFININPEIGCNVAQEQVNILTDEQIIGLGVLGFLGLIPAVLKGLFSKTKIFILLSCAFILNILILARFMAFMEYSMRFVLAFACFSAPLFALIYGKKGLYKALLCFFCMFYMGIIPYHIKRAPAFKIFPYLIQNKFDIEKLNKDCFDGKIFEIWYMTNAIRSIIDTRYPKAQKIGYFKTTKSSALNLKRLYDVDFLTSANIDKYDLNKYDLLIFEGEIQNDDTFKNAEINYKIENGKIFFINNNLNCYYVNNSGIPTDKKELATVRWCFGTYYFMKNQNFKLDMFYDFEDKYIEKTRLYFFTKLN